VKHRSVVLVFAVLAGFAGPVTAAHAATLTPNTILDETTAGDGQCSLREAISATRAVGTPGDCGTASGTDTIMLGASTYTLTIAGAGENANLTGDLDLGTNALTAVTISGAGPGATTIDAGGASGLGDRILEFVGPSSFALSGLTLTGGHVPIGAASRDGGAIRAVATGTLAILNCVITGNQAADGVAGSGIADPGGPGGAGGGIYATTRLTVTDSVISANHAGNGGAGGAGADSDKGNGEDGGEGGDGGAGGGIFANGATTSLTITNTTISGNSAGSGGAGGAGGSGFGSIAAGGTGGAGGFGAPGGGVGVLGETLAIANSTLSGNSAGAGGTGGRGGAGNTGGTGGIGENGGNAGGIFSAFNQMNLTNVTLANNSAGTGGRGGTGGPADDTAGASAGSGGNGARGGDGGAIFAVTLENSNSLIHGTLSGNAAGAAGPGGSGGKGGGATGTSGVAGFGGEIANNPQTTGSPLNVANTITVGGSPPACFGSVINGGHNDFADGCNGPPGPNPLLGPLQNNGGPTQTMALQPGSPAIDLVPTLVAQCQPADQRGVSRPAGAACDAGAYEVAPPAATTGPATGVDSAGATLTGTVRPNSGDAAVHFEYGPTTGYGNETAVQHLSGASDQPVTAALTGLTPATTYHFRVIATTADGTATGGDQTFTTAPPGAAGDGGPPALVAATGLRLVPSSFRGASSGPAAKVSVGTTARYTLNVGARVRFTVARLLPGRRGRGGRCVKPTRQNRTARRCTRRVRVRGSFTRTGIAGPNRFRFMGRIGGRKLKPGAHRLVATPSANGVRGRSISARFHIVP
jgi:hypothetical protein